MDAIFGFIWGLIQLIIFLVVVVAIIAAWGYNTLRGLSESIRESWSNISIVGKKQISLVNQLIDVVKSYQESENLVMLKVSEDTSSANNIAQMHQQSGMVLSAVNGIAQKFPELKSNQQYQRLIDSIQACEGQLESARQKYNADVKTYNIKRSSMPHVFYASTLGFRIAPYLEFEGNDQTMDMGTLKSFASDDGERLNQLLGQAGNKLMETGTKALEGGKAIAGAAQDKIKQLQEAQEAKSLPAPDHGQDKPRSGDAAADQK
jgi:LemA protein